MNRFATEHPLLLVLALLVGWIATTLLIALAVAALSSSELGGSLAQSMGTLIATGLLLWLTWRLGWLRAAGFTRLGSWKVWLLTVVVMVIYYVAYRYAFFGTLASDLGLLFDLPEARVAFLRQLVVGFVEEALFRGVLLYALVRVWGTARRGLFAAALIPALLFGSLHILQLSTGNGLPDTLLTVALAALSGIWMGALVLRWGSIWPAVVIHAQSNMILNVGALAVAGFEAPTSGFVLALVVEIPLALIGAWWLFRAPLVEGTERPEVAPGRLPGSALAH